MLRNIKRVGCIYSCGFGAGLILAIFCLIFGRPLIGLLLWGEMGPGCADLEQQVRVTLPPSATNIESSCSFPFGPGFTAFAKFNIAPEDIDLVVESTLIQQPLSNYGQIDNMIFWDEDLQAEITSIDQYLYGKYMQGEGIQEILIDTSNSDRYTVYIVMSGG